MEISNKKINIVFFGTPEFSVKILAKMKEENLEPSLIITTPDKQKGRKLILTPPATKIWGENNKIPIQQPKKLKDETFLNKLKEINPDLFIVASYGKIIPQEILDIPKHGTINVHPSLLPKLRGASPLESAILNEEKTGMTIMLMDKEMDHGAILTQQELNTDAWPISISKLEDLQARLGGKLLTETIPLWVKGKIKQKEQDHSKATYVDKIEKKDAFIDFDKDSPEKNYRKILALQKFKPYFFLEKNGKKIRIIIKKAELKDEKLSLIKIIPEGKKEMNYQDFIRKN